MDIKLDHERVSKKRQEVILATIAGLDVCAKPNKALMYFSEVLVETENAEEAFNELQFIAMYLSSQYSVEYLKNVDFNLFPGIVNFEKNAKLNSIGEAEGEKGYIDYTRELLAEKDYSERKDNIITILFNIIFAVPYENFLIRKYLHEFQSEFQQSENPITPLLNIFDRIQQSTDINTQYMVQAFFEVTMEIGKSIAMMKLFDACKKKGSELIHDGAGTYIICTLVKNKNDLPSELRSQVKPN